VSKFYQVLDITHAVQIDAELYKAKTPNNYMYATRKMAVDNAKIQAGKQPGTQYAVMAIEAVFEAAIPKIIEKKFTEEGELLNV
jgi:hypothetical protein